VTPGIIDAHSHTAIDGDVNEGTHNVTAEVRIRDVIDPFSVAVYRELAGGTTTANVLHGSANAIGGQNQIVKWRWGAGPEGMDFAGAPEGIKFALGENPKQSNWGNPRPRYPRTRMGVAELIRERFQAAEEYRARQAEYRKAAAVKGSHPIPPEPDLQLEAIAEILEGKRQIHCHSYRKDEMLQMLRSAEEFGVRVATLQHALEGYKIADEIARHDHAIIVIAGVERRVEDAAIGEPAVEHDAFDPHIAKQKIEIGRVEGRKTPLGLDDQIVRLDLGDEFGAA